MNNIHKKLKQLIIPVLEMQQPFNIQQNAKHHLHYARKVWNFSIDSTNFHKSMIQYKA